jgi:integral membrane protein
LTGRVRFVGLVEGVSFLVLLGVAMPLKYLADRPEAVLIVGWAHGILFMLYAGVVLQAWLAQALTFGMACAAAVAAVLPGGPFVLDIYLRRLESQSDRIPTTPGSPADHREPSSIG